jgi:hypothetical protein
LAPLPAVDEEELSLFDEDEELDELSFDDDDDESLEEEEELSADEEALRLSVR